MKARAADHPSKVLFSGEKLLPAIAPCEHIAGNEKTIRKAMALQAELGGAFDLTCDCEDGATVGQEREHAAMVARLLAGNLAGRVGVRVHDLSSAHWRHDVDVVVGEAGAQLAYVSLPKCTGASDVARMSDYVARRHAASGSAAPLPIHVLIETHGALREVDAIAGLPQVETIDFGLLDFVSAHHGALGFDAMRSPLQFEHPLLVRAKTQIVAAALAHGVVPAHNVSLSLRDEPATFADARRAREQFGFLRMWSIHPAQVRPIVEAMQPAHTEVAHAATILLAARAAGWGPIDHQGDLHDRASYRHCWTVLQRAHVARMAMPQAARHAFFD